jgi:lipopolysaccharide transport protein LptA
MAALRAKHLVPLLAALATALCGTGLLEARAAARPASQADRERLPITVDAAETRGDIKNNKIVFIDVIISQGDVRIQAKQASVAGGLDYNDSRWTISGNVRIDAQGGNLTSDEAVITFANNAIARAVITGKPAQFEQLRAGTTEPARGRAKTIEYETATGNVSFRSDAWLSDGCSEIRGEQLVYNIRSQSVQAQSVSVATGAQKQRVKITIQPQSPSGTPCSAPGKKQP